MNTEPRAVCAKGEKIEGVLAALQERLGPRKFNAWFKNGALLTVEDGHVRVTVPNSFVANWIETHYQSDIAAAVQAQTGKSSPVVITIDPALSGKLRPRQLDMQAQIVARAADGRERPGVETRALSLRHKLEDFVVGESNKLAYTAAMAIAGGQAPFNPLVIHGPCGVGKTHLLQGVCISSAGWPSRTRW